MSVESSRYSGARYYRRISIGIDPDAPYLTTTVLIDDDGLNGSLPEIGKWVFLKRRGVVLRGVRIEFMIVEEWEVGASHSRDSG
jgi:hypothetical protein